MGLGFRVWVEGFRAWVQGSRFRAWVFGLAFRIVWKLRVRGQKPVKAQVGDSAAGHTQR